MIGFENGKINQFNSLFDALRDERPRPDKQSALFAAASLMGSSAEPAFLTRAIHKAHEQLKNELGSFKAPTGSLRWLYASLLASQGKPAERFLQAQSVLRQARKDKIVPHLYAGGARAALVLTLSAEPSPDTIQHFIAMKSALTPPWWRTNTGITDTFTAAHVAAGHTPEEVLARRERALEIFADNKLTRHHKRDASRLCALLEQEPGTVLERVRTLEAWRKDNGYVRHRTDRSMIIQWASEGLTPEDLTAIEAIARELKHCSGAGNMKFRLAHLIHTEGGSKIPVASISALSAIIAAQAVIIASTVTVTTAAASSS